MLLPFRPKRNEDDDPILKTEVFEIQGGLNFNISPVKLTREQISEAKDSGEFLSGGKNIYIRNKNIRQRFGYVEFGNEIPLEDDLPVVGIFSVWAYNYTNYLLAFTTERAYQYNTTTHDWEEITDAAEDYSGDIDDVFSLDVIYDDDAGALKYVSTNRVEAVKKWTGTGNWDDLGGSPNKCKFLKTFHHYLMLFDVVSGDTRYPQRIDWCTKGAPETWTGGSSGNVHLVKTTDFIIGAEHIKGQLAIFKENSITMCSYVGGINPFEFVEKSVEGIGCKARETIRSFGDQSKIIFLGEDLNVYVFDGYDCVPVANRIQDKFLDSINPENISRSHAHLIEELNLYLLFVPKVGATYPNSVWVYDYIEDNWNYWEFADNITTTGHYLSAASITIGELTDQIKTFGWRIGSRTIHETKPISLFGDSAGYIYKSDETQLNDNGTAIEAEFETKSYFPAGTEKFARNISISLYGQGDTVQVHASKDDGKSYVKQGNIILPLKKSGVGFLKTVELTSEKIMYKISNTVLDTYFEIEGWILYAIAKGKKVIEVYLNYLYSNNEERVIILNDRGEREYITVRS